MKTYCQLLSSFGKALKEQYFELSVLGSNEQSLKELVFELGVTAIEELENGFIVRSNDDLELVELGVQSLAQALNISISTQIQIKNNSDWISSYQNSIKPVKCGSFYIRPSWHESSKDDINIIIDPALAFGSGHHESTSSCLELISEFCAGKKELKTALDVGCGSGILSIALAKIDFEVSSCDTESQAVESTKQNASKNSVELKEVLLGSIDKANAAYDVICANIIADVIFMLAPELKARLNEGGYLILSGILDRYKERILSEFSELKLIKNITKNEWESFIYQKIAK